MSKSEQKIRTNLRNYILALVFLLLTNAITSYTLAYMSHKKLHNQIEKRMFDIANTAADAVIGDFLATYQGTEEEQQTEEYQRSKFVLDTIYENIDLSYIYCVRHEGNDKFVFIIDPDKDNPADFGEEILATDALRMAQSGNTTIDKEPHTDEWGTFYSAYSPVFDFNGNVVSVIGIDFDAKQHDSIIKSFVFSATVLTAISLVIGIALAAYIMLQNKKRTAEILESVNKLDREMKKLDYIIIQNSAKRMEMLPESENAVLKTLVSGEISNNKALTEYDALSTGVDSVYSRLKKYIKYIDNEVKIDDTTGVYNKATYKQKVKAVDNDIAEGKGNFSVAFFDIDGIKKIYTYFGFEAGEVQMYNCSKLLMAVFGRESIYHITGDEFVIIADNKSRFEMEELFEKFDQELKNYNAEHVKDHILSVSKGFATYNAEKHKSYRNVFVEAEQNCANNKADHYKVPVF